MKNRQPFVASVFRAVKKKKQREPRSTQDLARNMRPVSKRGKKYNRCTYEKHVTLVGAGSRKGLYYYYTMLNPPPDPHTVLEPMNQLKVFPYSIL